MVRRSAKIVAETDLYETDKEVQNLIDWVCLSEQIKENNNTNCLQNILQSHTIPSSQMFFFHEWYD